MRLNSKDIKLLAVDEPTSALDAEAEERLLEKFLEEKKGRTVIFVTHKFGKLTRKADLIMYTFLPPRAFTFLMSSSDA